MNPDDYVSYPIALALKKAGFDEPCMAFYEHTDGQMLVIDGEEDWNRGIDYSAPFLWQARKWLRDRCGIHVNACKYSGCIIDTVEKVCNSWDFWGFDLYVVIGCKKIYGAGYDSYEQALSAGIAAALELIENNKNN